MSDGEYSVAEQVSNIGDLKKQRGTLKGRLTLFEKYIAKYENVKMSDRQQAELLLRMESVSNVLITFTNIQDKIEQLLDDSELDKQLEYRASFEDQYFSIMSIAKCLTDVIKIKDANDNACSNTNYSNLSSIKLPQITLPSFDGSYDRWLEYKNTYLSMIHRRSDLDAIQKFHYLKSSLSGSALQVISALEFTAANYTHAWELLENRYHNNRLLIHNHVNALFAAQSISKESPSLIRDLIDVMLRNLRALKSLDEPTDTWDTLVIHIIVSKLDSSTEREWENYLGSMFTGSHKTKTKLDDLFCFLRNRADMLDMLYSNHPRSIQDNKSHKSDNKRHAGSSIHQTHSYVSTRKNNGTSETSKQPCTMCGQNHPLFICFKFLNLAVPDRIKFVDSSKDLCHNCLRPGHLITECVFGPCKQCTEKHNTLLHNDNNNVLTIIPASSAASSDAKPVSVVSHANNLLVDNAPSVPLPQVLLSTALVEVMDNNRKYYTARALIDSGSQNCFISEKLCKRLNVSIIQSTIRISGVGQSVSQSTKLCDINMRSKTSNFKICLRCFVLPCITTSLPATHIVYDTIHIPDNVCLADPTFNLPSEIDLLIGADVFWDLLDADRIRLSNGPHLQNSKLGWLISGPIHNKPNVNRTQCNFVQQSNIDTQLRKFWELEEVVTSGPILTEEDRRCEEFFVSTTTRDSSGRFSVRIPLKEPANALGDSYENAKSRFLSLERKLDRSPSYKRLYSDFIREYIELGHMSRISEPAWPHYFLPHHGVLREHSTTTKLRVVFDASATTTSNKSFNDIQMIGPPLQNDIFSILLRFRQYKYVACADVEKMYRQVLVHDDQRNLQLILWRENASDELSIYRLNTVTYGTASAPYLSMRCLRQLAQETEDKVIAKVINEDFFVDDLITGDNDPQVLLKTCEKTSEVLRSACFPLRKWTFSNDVNVEASKELAIGEHCQNKTLGLGWQVDKDELYFTTTLQNKSEKVTKRSMMSVISQIYDPLGLLSPTVITAKILLQRLWLCKIDWDDAIPDDVECLWTRFLQDLSSLSNIRVPRCVMREYGTYNCELHIFTDASQDAYGACAYVRTYTGNSSIVTNLLCAKSKVAPVKTVCTIPRLELCGALLGARLYRKIISSLRMTFTKVVFWTDSTIVMGWIRMSPHSLKTFVQNRVSQINELTGDAIWLHVNGKDNPADIVSRGLPLNELQYNNMWWHGPDLLRQDKFDSSCDINIDSNQLPDLKTQKVSMLCTNLNDNIIDFNRFSSFNRLRRATAYVLRFIGNTRASVNDRRTGSLSVDELDASVVILARLAQRQSFYNEHNDLIKQSVVKSKRLLGLNVFLDKYKLIRVGGRLSNASHFDNNKKHPVLLCSKHRFTILLFSHEHKQLLHGGPQLLLACVREAWWPLGGRNLARKTVNDCVTCTRIKGKTMQPLMGNLPAERLEPGFPFMRCGVDYAGPVMILNRRGRGASLTKAYICLFVCLCTRAIHLELVTSLSTNDYLLALKRFISRRGKPAEIMSDNGKNFVGAEKEFVSFIENNSKDINDFASNNNIKFSFIPPYAPHFGGLWEAGVKSCKHHLRRVVGGTNLTYEEFSTVLAQTEAILNSRPLTALSTDPNDLQPLTPAHFLIGRPLTAPACQDLTATPTHRLQRYDVIEQIRQGFWKRWASEYVSELQTRTKWKSNQHSLTLNQLALIKEENLPPLRWKLGRIVRIHPGADGISRVADLLTASGVTRRAFSKICPLPSPLSVSDVTSS